MFYLILSAQGRGSFRIRALVKIALYGFGLLVLWQGRGFPRTQADSLCHWQKMVRTLEIGSEIRLLRRRLGFRSAIVNLGVVAAFGVVLPWAKGLEFFDSLILTAYACLGAVFAGPAAAYRRDEPAPTFGQARSRVLVSAAYGHLVGWVLLIAGVATVYISHRGSAFFPPDLATIAAGLALGLALSLALSAVAVWTSLRFSEMAARMALRLLFLGLLIAFFRGGRRLPDMALDAALLCIAGAAGVVAALRPAIAHRQRGAA